MAASPLPTSLDWVNCSEPPTLDALRGNVVILHFFTASCLHCQSSLNALRMLMQQYDETLAVLSIHCPKYPREHDGKDLQKAINRIHVKHPVAQDSQFEMWHQNNISAWPTALVLDTKGKMVHRAVGVREIEALDSFVEELITGGNPADFRPTIFPEWRPAGREPQMPLQFPMDVCVTPEHLYISDSGHNRIIEAAHNGRVLRSFGSGAPGLWDGDLTESGFDSPGAIMANGGNLYVADVGNHALRRINLLSGEVATIAGTGKRGWVVPDTPVDAQSVALNYPTSMAMGGDSLYFTVAANNQIWRLDLGAGTVEVFAGSGMPQLHNATGNAAGFSSPRGLALTGETLLVADSENGAIRAINCKSRHVSRLAGTGPFTHGDSDGDFARAQFQLPTAIVSDPTVGALFVADTMNNAIRVISVKSRQVSTLDLNYRLHQPQGLAVHGGKLWVANTHSHELVKIDPASGEFERIEVVEAEI